MNISGIFRSVGFILVGLSLHNCVYFSEYAKLERSAHLAYSRGDYDTAVYMLARSLQLNQEYEKSQLLAADAFLMANKIHQKQISQLENNTYEFKYDDLVREYQSLVNLHDAVELLPPIRHPKTATLLEFEIIDYSKPLQQARESAAESHYLAGDKLAASQDMSDQKSAAKEFKRAQSFVHDYKDSAQRYTLTRKAGIKRIAVFPFEDLSGKKRKYGAIEELVVDQMVSSVMRDPSATEFLELINRDQLDRVIAEQKFALSGLVQEETAVEVGAILGVHEIITGKITQIIYTPVQTTHRDYKEQKKVVIKTEKYKDKEGKTKTRKIYGDVEARVKHFSRSTEALIKGSYRIVDVKTSKLVKSEAFEGKSSFKTEWATFKGDERALKGSTSRLVRKGESNAPVGDDMVSRAAADLANSLSATLKIYAR